MQWLLNMSIRTYFVFVFVLGFFLCLEFFFCLIRNSRLWSLSDRRPIDALYRNLKSDWAAKRKKNANIVNYLNWYSKKVFQVFFCFWNHCIHFLDIWKIKKKNELFFCKLLGVLVELLQCSRTFNSVKCCCKCVPIWQFFFLV